jgi:hypothetical protein
MERHCKNCDNLFEVTKKHPNTAYCGRLCSGKSRFSNLAGQHFGRLTAIKLAGKTEGGNYRWECSCECGKSVVVVGGHLRSGHTKSCGCTQGGWFKGKKLSTEHRKALSLSHLGKFQDEASSQWRGDKVGYSGLHEWVRRKLGTPDACEHCGKVGLKGRQIHWANKSRNYQRDLTDWVRLCVSCHWLYDGKVVGRNQFISKKITL